ncbi:hypothetical protein BT69DRAFT_1019331 [Atractiella rhizophila]|nr:hypothetical protein BT69DRAFT_1019331 [Atractiella rhizophila]
MGEGGMGEGESGGGVDMAGERGGLEGISGWCDASEGCCVSCRKGELSLRAMLVITFTLPYTLHSTSTENRTDLKHPQRSVKRN